MQQVNATMATAIALEPNMMSEIAILQQHTI